jgi:hypothetical protein
MVNPEHGISRVVHHKDYYLRGGDMTVLVSHFDATTAFPVER